MKSLLNIALLILLSITCSAQRFKYITGPVDSDSYYEEIPYQSVNGKMFISAEVNGKQRKFLFDTGAPAQITTDLFYEIAPHFIANANIADGNGLKDSLELVTVSQIKLKSIVFNQVPALVTYSDAYDCWGIDGVVGSNMLAGLIVKIDPLKHIIVLTDDEKRLHLNHSKRDTLMADSIQNDPFVPLRTEGQKHVLAAFDTGSMEMLSLAERDLKNFEKGTDFEIRDAGYGSGHRSVFGLGPPDSTYLVRLKWLTFGGHMFSKVTTETNTTAYSRIGTKMLDFGAVTLDFIHHYVYFEPNTANLNASEKQWPLQPVIDDGKWIVGVVWQNLKGSVTRGEQIVAVDGTPCPAANLCAWLNTDNPELLGDKSTAELTIKDANGHLKIVVIKKE